MVKETEHTGLPTRKSLGLPTRNVVKLIYTDPKELNSYIMPKHIDDKEIITTFFQFPD